MGEWLVSIEGTETGHLVAMGLALLAALLHAAFGALQKGKADPWISRGAIDAALIVLSLPIALFLVPWPKGIEWALVWGTLVIHFFYKLGMAMAYSRGAYSVVYPVVRGAGVMFTVIGAWVVFGETFSGLQWFGVLLLVGAILGIAVANYRKLVEGRETLLAALGFALLTGLWVSVYTTYDAYGIRTMPNPFTFVAWFFLISSLDFPFIAWHRYRRMETPPALRPLAVKAVFGAVIAYGSFGAVMLATRLDKVGEAAVLRETSTVFAALIGWLVLKERIGALPAVLMCVIALGAVIVEFGG